MLPIDDDKILVFLVRHGQTVANAENCFRGPLNVPLDRVGYQQAHQLAALFTPICLAGIFHSDKKRAAETAKIIHADREEPLVPNENLRAWNVGWFGGKSKDKYAKELEYYVEHPDATVPEGESLNDFRRRVQPLFRQAVDLAMTAGLPIMLVVHSSLIHEAGNMLHGTHSAALVLPGGVSAIFMDGGELKVSPVFRPDVARMKAPRSSDTVS